jgi:hypothetical protein
MPTRGSKFFECKYIYHKIEDKLFCNNNVLAPCLSKWQKQLSSPRVSYAFFSTYAGRRAFLLLLHFGVTVKVCELYVLLRTCTGWGGPRPLCSSFKLTLLKSSLAPRWLAGIKDQASPARAAPLAVIVRLPWKLLVCSRPTLARATPWPKALFSGQKVQKKKFV